MLTCNRPVKMEEDFDNNKFYLFLQNTFKRMYEDAQNKRYTVCLPCNSSICGLQFDLAFVENHILKPSPFFKGEFHTVHIHSDKRTVHIDGNTITTGEGFPEKKTVTIIGEEAGYNKDYEPYKIYLVDSPLVPVYVDQKRFERATSCTDFLKERTEVTECRQFLESVPGCKEDFQELLKELQVFQDSYLVVKGYLDDTASKLKEMYQRFSQSFRESTDFSDKSDSRFITNLNNAVESVMMYTSHSKLFPVICAQCQVEEERFYTKLTQLVGVKATQLGLQQEYLCDMTSSVQCLKEMSELHTPLEIMHKMKHVLDSISTTVNSHVTFLQSSSKPDLSFITTDEMIPLLVLVVCQCCPSTLLTQMYYVEHFHWSTSAFDNLSFSLVSFRAAVQYIQSTDLLQLLASQDTNNSKSQARSQAAKPLELPAEPQSTSQPMSKSGRGLQFDRQLDRINRMFQTTTIGLPTNTALPPLAGKTVKKKANLGAFLDSLQDDTVQYSYGKQE